MGGFKVSAYRSPLESVQSLGRDEHERMNRALADERREFLGRVEVANGRKRRKAAVSAVALQRFARGYVSRRCLAATTVRLAARNGVREQLRGIFAELSPGAALTGRQARGRKREREGAAALTLQCRWRRTYAVARVAAIREAAYHSKLQRSAAKIQSHQRKKLAAAAVVVEREKAYVERLDLGAGTLQRQFRGHLARKKVNKKRDTIESKAAGILQTSCRCFVARCKVAARRKLVAEELSNRSAVVLTRFFAWIAARSKGARIRMVTRKFVREGAAATIQRLARKSAATRKVGMRLFMIRTSRRLRAVLNLQRIVRGFVARAVVERMGEKTDEAPSIITELFSIIRKKDEDAAENFISFLDHSDPSCPQPNDTDSKGNTALSIAAGLGLIQVIKKCLVWGTDPNIQNYKGLTATDLAVVRRHGVAASYLLSKEIVSVNMDGKTLIHEAAATGLVRVTEALLSHNVSANCVDPITLHTPLQDAVLSALEEGKTFYENHDSEDDGDEDEQAYHAKSHASCLELLLKSGGDPSVRDAETGESLAHLIARNGNLACMAALLDHEGGKFKGLLLDKDGGEKTAWVVAALAGNADMAGAIRDALSVDVGQVRLAAGVLTARDVRDFVVGLTTPDTVSPKTYRDKLQSVKTFNMDKRASLVKELVATGGVPVDVRAPGGLTCYMQAAKQGNVAAFAACMKMGADLSLADEAGRTVLHYVCGTHNITSSLEMLNMCVNGLEEDEAEVTKNLNVDEVLKKPDSRGRLPLHYAAFRANTDVISLILERNLGDSSDASTPDAEGSTALHYVSSIVSSWYKANMVDMGFNSHMDMKVILPSDSAVAIAIRALRKGGADADIENDAELSAFMVACAKGNLNAVKVILGDWKESVAKTESAIKSEKEDGKVRKELGLQLVFGACHAVVGGFLDCLKVVTNHDKYTVAHSHAGGMSGLTVLGHAIKNNRFDIASFLIETVQVNPTKQCYQGGGNSLHLVATWADKKMLDLVAKHAKMVPVMFERKNEKGETPLLCGTRVGDGQFKVVISLIKKGSDVGPASRERCSAWIQSAAITQMAKGKGKDLAPRCMSWKGRKFYVFGLKGVQNIGDIAAPTATVTVTKANTNSSRNGGGGGSRGKQK